MKNILKNVLVGGLMMVSLGVEAQWTALSFDEHTRYSQVIIDACINDFYGNTKHTGLYTYNQDGTQKAAPGGTDITKIDYVPGLVCKAVIEAADFYQDEDFAKPWFYSVEKYGNTYYNGIETDGGSLDNLNAVKLYFKLGELAASGKFSAVNGSTVSNCNTAKSSALTGLGNTNSNHSIKAGIVDGTNNANALPKPGGGTYDVTGGWYHKSSYPNQLWCDGQYMGPALLAQYVADGQYISGSADGDWNIIVKQFDITWTYLWDSSKKLLYHAFCADGGTDNSKSYSNKWSGLSVGSCYHSATYWGRAEGWYVLALVDVLEQMDKAGMSKSDPRYLRLLGYLQSCAEGLKAIQTNGCWYQLLDPNLKTHVSAGGKSNYLESSCSAIFTAFFLKAIRLGYLDKATYETCAKTAYQKFVETFIYKNGDNYRLVNNCCSAGLGGKSDSDRTGTADYYLDGSDSGNVTGTTSGQQYNEGKVLGAFILAAVEYERAYLPVDHSCDCLNVEVR